MAWLEHDIGVEVAYEARNLDETAYAFCAWMFGSWDDVMIFVVEERVFLGMYECVLVFRVGFEKGFDKLFCVRVNTCFLIVDGVGEDCYVHGLILSYS